MKKVCYIAGAGCFIDSYLPKDTDYIIAADGGLVYLRQRGFEPDLIIGDFDSLDETPAGKQVIQLNVRKDETDMAVAIDYGKKKDCDTFIVNGGTGKRLDHTLANIQLLIALAKENKSGYLIDNSCVITAIHNSKLCFFDDKCQFSIFCMDGMAKGVYETATGYTLENATINSDKPLGISNYTISENGSVMVREGTLVVTFTSNLRKIIELN